jgi:hypothetical protein
MNGFGFNAIPNIGGYVLKTTDNLQTILDSGIRVVILDPAQTYTMNNILIPSGTKIIGNGSTIISPDTTHPVFKLGEVGVDNTTDVLLKDINFKGSTADTNNLAAIGTDIGIDMYKTARCKIRGCHFDSFLGAGISTSYYPTNSSTSSRESQQNLISENTFYKCYYGFVNWQGSEYGICSNNLFNFCRCAIWSQSGNWLFAGNIIVRCRAGFVTASALNTIATSLGSNLQHGTVSGNVFNHCRSDQTTAWSTDNYFINGVDYHGIYVDGADSTIPPLFTGNTAYYTDLRYYNSASSGMPYWFITGCTFSNDTIYCDAATKMGLAACCQFAAVTKTNVVSLISYA